MADCIQRLAQDIMNSDRLWSQLTPDGKIRMLRMSMGLPPAKSSVHSPIKSEPAEQLREKHDRSFFVESEARLQRMDDCIRETDAILQRMQKINQDFLAKSQKQQEGQPRSIEELGTSYQNQSKLSDFGVPLGDQAEELDMSGNGSVNSSQETSDQSNFVETIEDARKVLDGMPNKEAVPFPSEVPEIRSMLMNEDASRFNSVSPIQFNDRTMFVKIHSLEYRISCQVLELVFSRFGILEDVEILHSGSEFHSRIHFRDRDSAIKALEYDGRDIYDGCCQLELFLGSTLAKERWVPKEAYSSGETSRNKGFQQIVAPTDSTQALSQQHLQQSHSNQEPTETLFEISGDSLKENQSKPEFLAEEHFSIKLSEQMENNFEQIQNRLQVCHWETGDAWQEVDEDPKELQVISNLLETTMSKFESKKMVDISVVPIQTKTAYKVYEKMPEREIALSKPCIEFNELSFSPLIESRVLTSNWIDFAGNSNHAISNGKSVFVPFDRGKSRFELDGVAAVYVNRGSDAELQEFLLYKFDVYGKEITEFNGVHSTEFEKLNIAFDSSEIDCPRLPVLCWQQKEIKKSQELLRVRSLEMEIEMAQVFDPGGKCLKLMTSCYWDSRIVGYDQFGKLFEMFVNMSDWKIDRSIFVFDPGGIGYVIQQELRGSHISGHIVRLRNACLLMVVKVS